MTVRAYVRLDPAFPDHKAVYPDGAVVALTFCFCFGAQQPRPGWFRNRRLLAALLDRRARWIPYLVERRDLIEHPDGSLYIEGWEEWQEGNWQVAERMRRVRDRNKGDGRDHNSGDGADRNKGDGADRNAPSASRVPRDVARAPRESASAKDNGVSVSVGGNARDPNGEAQTNLALLAERLTQHPYVMVNTISGLGAKAVEMAAEHGEAEVAGSWERIAARVAPKHPTFRQLVLGADDELNPIPGRMSETERKADEQKQIDRFMETGSL